MDQLLATIADIRDSRVGGGDCFCDRLNCKYTVYLMVAFSLLVTTRRYVGDQVSCWCPSHFTDSHRQYANQVSEGPSRAGGARQCVLLLIPSYIFTHTLTVETTSNWFYYFISHRILLNSAGNCN